MRKETFNYLKNKELLKVWSENHPEHMELISAFERMEKSHIEHKQAEKGSKTISKDIKLTISVGRKKRHFYPLLTSYEQNPRVLFSSVKNSPMILINRYKSGGGLIGSIQLKDIFSLKIEEQKNFARFFLEMKYNLCYEIYINYAE